LWKHSNAVPFVLNPGDQKAPYMVLSNLAQWEFNLEEESARKNLD